MEESKYLLERTGVKGEAWVTIGSYDTEDDARIAMIKAVRNGDVLCGICRVVKKIIDPIDEEIVTATDIFKMFDDFCKASPCCIDCEYGRPGCHEKTSVDCLSRFIKEWKDGIR